MVLVRVLVSVAGSPTYAVGDEVSMAPEQARAWAALGYVDILEDAVASRPVETATATRRRARK